MAVVEATQDAAFENMVSGVYGSSYNATENDAPAYLFSASYAAPGGVVVFDAAALARNGSLVEVGRSISHNSSRANRMHLRACPRRSARALSNRCGAPENATPTHG